MLRWECVWKSVFGRVYLGECIQESVFGRVYSCYCRWFLLVSDIEINSCCSPQHAQLCYWSQCQSRKIDHYWEVFWIDSRILIGIDRYWLALVIHPGSPVKCQLKCNVHQKSAIRIKQGPYHGFCGDNIKSKVSNLVGWLHILCCSEVVPAFSNIECKNCQKCQNWWGGPPCPLKKDLYPPWYQHGMVMSLDYIMQHGITMFWYHFDK